MYFKYFYIVANCIKYECISVYIVSYVAKVQVWPLDLNVVCGLKGAYYTAKVQESSPCFVFYSTCSSFLWYNTTQRADGGLIIHNLMNAYAIFSAVFLQIPTLSITVRRLTS